MDFIITTDSTCDMPASYAKEHDLTMLPLGCYIGEEDFSVASEASMKRFYQRVREGAAPVTNQITPAAAEELFQRLVDSGKRVLHIGFSSALSGSYDSALLAAQTVNERSGEHKVVVIDSLCASMGEGLLVYYAHKLQKEGKSLEQVADWAEKNKLNICHYLTVDDLMHLHRGGRVSKATAIVGGALGIKPVLHVDDEGKIVPLHKERGKKNTLHKVVDIMEKLTKGVHNDVIYVCHGDCIEDAEYITALIKKQLGVKQVVINMLGTTTGAHAGPGTIAVFFMGIHR